MGLSATKRKRWAGRLTLATAAGMGVLLLVFLADPYKSGVLAMPAELWAMHRRWQFYLLVGVVCGGVLAGMVAWRWGKTDLRLGLIGIWAAFITMLVTYHGQRVSVMAKLIFQQAGL